MVPALTTGAILRMLNGEEVPNAVLQILGCKRIPGTGSERYRLLISDGVTGCPYGMLGTQLNQMVHDQQLERFTVIKVDKFVCNQVQPDRKVVIILNLTILATANEVGEKIGNPINTFTSKENAAQENGPRGALETVPPVFSAPPPVSAPPQPEPQAPGIDTIPIASLTPYQNRWTIKARVTSKTPIRNWSNSRGEGKLFSLNLLDETGEIRATAFTDAVDRFYDMLEVNKIYYFSKLSIKSANARFNSVKNDFELTFTSETVVAPCEQGGAAIPMLQFDFVPIAQLENVDREANVDIIGVCRSVAEPYRFVARTTNREMVKRELRLVDRSGKEVVLTLWGNEAETFDGTANPVVAVKCARISDFNGRSLSVGQSSVLQINPDIREAHVLKGWYDREGHATEVQSLSARAGGPSVGGTWKTFAQAIGERLGMGEKPDYYINKGTVVMVRKENCMYMACPSEECNKKVVDMNNGLFRCEKCNREYSNFKWRLLLSASIADFSDSQWVTCFQDAAESVLDIKADALGAMKESEEERYNEVLADANFKSFIFKMRIKMETFNEESRLKTTVVSATPVQPREFGRKLLADIKEMARQL